MWDPSAGLTIPGFGRHIPLFYLMENPKSYRLSSNVENFVSPFNFFAPITFEEDYCLYWLFCRYEEDQKQDDAYLKFYETYDKAFLIGITYLPLNEKQFMDYAANDFLDLKQLNEKQRIVWTRTFRDPSAQEDERPTDVRMLMEYYQMNSTHKLMVRSSMTFGNFTTISQHPVFTTSWRGQEYVFVFELTAMPWLDLLDQFALAQNVYLIFYCLWGLVF